jgi:hypothetical protein
MAPYSSSPSVFSCGLKSRMDFMRLVPVRRGVDVRLGTLGVGGLNGFPGTFSAI